MSRLDILKWPDPRLSQICAPVGDAAGPEVKALVQDMFDTLYAAKGRGLAAPQVGVMKRIFVMDAGWKTGERTPLVCMDPVIAQASAEKVTGPEACLSIPGVTARVSRHAEIRLMFTDLEGVRLIEPMQGFDAICAQHELDHLDGRVHFDRLEPDLREGLMAEYAAGQGQSA